MNVGDLKRGLDSYPDDATLMVAVSIPDLYINTMANATIVPSEDQKSVRIVAVVPSRKE